ncbi:MAG: hypothetical protein IJM59_02580 [Proteobacteria bacterium]|jgi:nucleoside-triphosphatase THEP1|nr:hypothetical protein [Pseudomonadota bacterium]
MDMNYLSCLEMLETASQPLRIAVTGGRHVGKTTALKLFYAEGCRMGISIYGVVENAVFVGERRVGYEFMDLFTKETCAVAHRTESLEYCFFDQAWVWAESKLKISQGYDVLIVDELGRIEAQNEGWMPMLCRSLKMYPRHLIASVRDDALPDIESILGKFDEIVWI